MILNGLQVSVRKGDRRASHHPRTRRTFYTPKPPEAESGISKEGPKVFFILFRPPGSRKLTRYSVGYHPSGRLGPGKGRPLPQMTLKEFEIAYAIFRGELAQGRDPRRKEGAPRAAASSPKVSRCGLRPGHRGARAASHV